MNIIQKITTSFVEEEDRIRLVGENADGETLIIWLSRRLMNRLIPVVFNKINVANQPVLAAKLIQEFAQHAAVSSIPKAAPIIPNTESIEWLASSIDIADTATHLNLSIKNETELAVLSLEITQVRQWLAIVHHAYIKAAWDDQIWPDWFIGNHPSAEIRH